MENRRILSYSHYPSLHVQARPQATNIERDSLGSYRPLARQQQQRSGQPDPSDPRLKVPIRGSVSRPTLQTTHIAANRQGNDQSQGLARASVLPEGAHISHLTPNYSSARLNTSLSAEYGSQFAPDEYRPAHSLLTSSSNLDTVTYGIEKLGTDPYKPRYGGLGPYAAIKPLNDGRLPSENSPAYELNNSMTNSSATRTFSTPEPWVSFRSNHFSESQDRLRPMPRPPAFHPYDNNADTSNGLPMPLAASSYSQYDVTNLSRDEPRSGRIDSAINLKIPQYKTPSESGVDELGFHHVSQPGPGIPMDYVQGRRSALELAINDSVGQTSSTGTNTLSRRGISQTTWSTRNTSNPQQHSLGSHRRRSSTRTSTTTATSASQDSRSSNSARRDPNVPEPLFCPQCPHKAFTGLDRLTNRKRHIREVHGNFRVVCSNCNQAFTRQWNLERHRDKMH